MHISKKGFIFLASIIDKLPFSSLLKDSSGTAWDKAENDLLNYNKTVLTISSSSLVLSFSVIKVTGIHINIVLLGISWVLLSLALVVGVCLLFTKFFASLADGILFAHDGKKITPEKVERLQVIYFTSLTLIYYLGVIELLTFIFGLLLLIGTVFASVN